MRSEAYGGRRGGIVGGYTLLESLGSKDMALNREDRACEAIWFVGSSVRSLVLPASIGLRSVRSASSTFLPKVLEGHARSCSAHDEQEEEPGNDVLIHWSSRQTDGVLVSQKDLQRSDTQRAISRK